MPDGELSHADLADAADSLSPTDFTDSHRFRLVPDGVSSHADFADDADLKQAVPRRNKARSKLSPGGPSPQNMARALMPRQP